MSEWDFLFGLEGEELMDAMSSGGTDADWYYIEEQEKLVKSKKILELQKLRNLKKISHEEFEKGKKLLNTFSTVEDNNYWQHINEQTRIVRRDEWFELKELRDSKKINHEEFIKRKKLIFPD